MRAILLALLAACAGDNHSYESFKSCSAEWQADFDLPGLRCDAACVMRPADMPTTSCKIEIEYINNDGPTREIAECNEVFLGAGRPDGNGGCCYLWSDGKGNTGVFWQDCR